MNFTLTKGRDYQLPGWAIGLLFPIVLCLAAIITALSNCATIGIGEQPRDQAVLEAASALMLLEYMDIKDGDLSDADIARALIKVGDQAVQGQGYVSFAALIETRLAAVTNGKFHPNVYMIYILTLAVLEDLEPAPD